MLGIMEAQLFRAKGYVYCLGTLNENRLDLLSFPDITFRVSYILVLLWVLKFVRLSKLIFVSVREDIQLNPIP